jgi:transcription termination factor Rho
VSNTDLLSGDLEARAGAQGSEDQTPQPDAPATPKRRPGGLSGMVIADLRSLAKELGISDTTGMRKGDLIAAIRERQGKSKRNRTGASADEVTLPLDGAGDAKGKTGRQAKIKADSATESAQSAPAE